MKYNYEELSKCTITKDMLLKWFSECYNENQGDIWDKDNINLEVEINGKKLENPLRHFERVEEYINLKVNEHCDILFNFKTYVERLAEKKSRIFIRG